MTESNFLQEVDLRRIISQIITDYRALTTIEIWYELGEDDRFDGGITRAEVTEVVSELEKQNIIIKGKDDKWTINSLGTLRLSRSRPSHDQAKRHRGLTPFKPSKGPLCLP